MTLFWETITIMTRQFRKEPCAVATIKDVAKKCGYSVCTVSRALSGKGYLKEETKQKIMEAVEELGYRPSSLAVNLKTGRRQTLALVLPSLTNIHYARLEKYMEACATEKGYIIYLNNTEYSLEKEKQIIENLIGMDIAGVIISPASREHAHIRKLADYKIPYVYLNQSFDDDLTHCLQMDNKQSAYNAVSYMIKLGHKQIGGIFQSFDNDVYRARYEGMTMALKEHHLPCEPEQMLFDVNPEDMSTTPGRILQMLQRSNRLDAIFACNDMTAFNVYRASYILGLHIPDHLSVFGFDDCTMANFVTPPLSTVSVPVNQMSKTAIDFIHHYIETGTYKELPVLKPSLVIRNSVRNLKLS